MSASPARRAVWEALSELYLDTELDEAALAHVARRLAASPYPPQELERTLLEEVHPVLAPNLLSAAGVWSGFDGDWLAVAIARHCRRPRIVRWLHARLLRGQAHAHWRQMAPRVRAQREADGPA